MRTITYHKTHSFRDSKGDKTTFVLQLYSIGIYGIINNNPALQFSLEPKDLAKMERKLKKAEAEGEITELVFGEEIIVSDETGFWKEIENIEG